MFGVKGVSRITTDAQSFSAKPTWPVGWQRHKWNNEGFRATVPFALGPSAVNLKNLLSLLSKKIIRLTMNYLYVNTHMFFLDGCMFWLSREQPHNQCRLNDHSNVAPTRKHMSMNPIFAFHSIQLPLL